MKTIGLRAVSLSLLIAGSAALGGCPHEAEGPRAGDSNLLAKMTLKALEIESTRPASEAFEAWSKVLVEARETRGTPLAREAALAAIDALSGRDVFGLESFGTDVGIAQRMTDGARKVSAVMDATLASDGAIDPMVRIAAASARMHLAAALGDGKALGEARRATGCALEATIVGPFHGPTLTALADAGPVDKGTIAATYTPNPLGSSAALALGTSAKKTFGRGCTLDTTGSARAGGLRYAVIDVDVPEAQKIAIGIESSLPAQVLVSGKTVIDLPYGEISLHTTRFGRVAVGAPGSVRVVVKLAGYQNEPIVIYALGEDGTPLVSHAAPVGAPPAATITAAGPELMGPMPASWEARVTRALALIAMGDTRHAENLVADVAKPTPGAKPPGAAALVYARTLVTARDLPMHRRLERLRAAYDATLAAWPSSWEAIIGHAQIVALQRRGGAGEIDAIVEARNTRDKIGKNADPLIDAYLALIADDIYGVREDSLAHVKPKLAGTWIGWKLERATTKETDDLAVKNWCDPKRFDVGRWECAASKAVVGDEKGMLAELARLRTLYGAPKLGVDMEITSTIKTAGVAAARTLYENADIVDRSSRLAVSLVPAGAEGMKWLRREIRVIDGDPRSLTDLINMRRVAGDTSAGPELASVFGTRTKALITKDRANPAKPDAGTLILAREETYELEADGFLHAVVYDVRRLGGTTDVEANASARVGTTSGGIGWVTRKIHRIFKADGQIVEPDRIAAAQAGAELSQIEPGDYVELVAEGYLLARADGALDLDTPDLLPMRTAVEHAQITLSVPASLTADLWSHVELGKPVVTDAFGKKISTWTMKDHGVRRTERGQTGLDMQVAMRWGTWSWKRLGREAREGVLADDERSPEVSAWIASAVGNDKAPTIDLLVRLAKASKRAIPRVGFLPLGVGNINGPQHYNARTVLLDAQGSRVELVHRALDELGVKNEIVWAEQQPYSADPTMVARAWRFTHAILVAHVSDKSGSAVKPVWIDLDVDGYPPPPGKTSPELRGRMAIDTKGEIIAVPGNVVEDPDVATIDLTVDDTGRAKGTFALLLRGRDAQDVAAVLEEEAGDERDDALRSYVLAWMPEADVLEVKASAETWQVMVTAKIEVAAMLVPDGTRYAIAGTPPLHGGGRAATLGATYASQAKRTTALTIRDAIQYTIHRVIRLPKGSSISTPLPSLDITDAETKMKATRKVKVDDSTIIEDLTFNLPTGVVSVKGFDDFTASARTIDDGFESVIRVMPASSMKIAAAPTTSASAKPLPKAPPPKKP